MKRIRARDLLGFSNEELWGILCVPFLLVFDDGTEIQTTEKEALYSNYFWEMHRRYPNTPLLPKHHVSFVLKGKALTSKTHIELMGLIYWDVVEAYNLKTPQERDTLTKMVYEITNYLYVDLSHRVESYVVSIDILDFIAVTRHPEVKPVLDNLSYGVAGYNTDYGRSTVEAAYKKLLDVLNNSPDMENNALARATRAKMVNANQVLQCVGPRGFLTDVDGSVMPVPVLGSYTSGMNTMYNAIVESRSAAKALYFSESPLQDSEYFARRLQLMCMVVERLHIGDCGSQKYMLWQVKPPTESAGRQIYPGDLKFMVGKFYLDEATNQLRAISANDTHLYGTTIKLRYVFGCQHPDPHTVCSTCFGKLSDNITPEANLGHVCAATMTRQTSQSVLSTKHLDASSSSEPIALSEQGRRFFSVGKNGNTFMLNKEEIADKVSMIVSQDEAHALTDITIVNNVEDINPSRISQIDYVTFRFEQAGEIHHVPICVSQNGRYAMFTHEFLKYLKVHKWNSDSRNNFVFDFSHWDFTKPVMALPEMEYSFSLHSHQIAEIIESRMKEIGDRMKPDSPISTLVELFELVNSKLNVNLALLEVILYATMINNGEEDNFGLARNSESASLGVADMTLKNRSLSAAYSYERQLVLITDPRSFYANGRCDSVFDAFVAPNEVVQAYKNR